MQYIGLPYCVWHVIGTFVNEHTTKCSCNMIISATAGGRLNKKDGLTRYGDSHVKDKTS